MIFAIVVIIITFLVISAVMGRQSKRNKRAAIEDLEREKEKLAQTDIFTLVIAEIEELALRSIAGATDLQPAVLLKAWKDHTDIAQQCTDRRDLRFVITDGVHPDEATADDVALICESTPNHPQPNAGPASDQDND